MKYFDKLLLWKNLFSRKRSIEMIPLLFYLRKKKKNNVTVILEHPIFPLLTECVCVHCSQKNSIYDGPISGDYFQLCVYMGNLIKKGLLIVGKSKLIARNCERIMLCLLLEKIGRVRSTGSNVYHDYTICRDRSTKSIHFYMHTFYSVLQQHQHQHRQHKKPFKSIGTFYLFTTNKLKILWYLRSAFGHWLCTMECREREYWGCESQCEEEQQ